MEQKIKVYVLHEYGARNHYLGVEEAVGKGNVEYFEFAIGKLVLKALLKRDVRLFLKQFYNIYFLLALPFISSPTIVLGMAPFDLKIIFFYFLLKRANVIYHSSWVDWKENYPKTLGSSVSKIFWKRFLKKVCGIACVTQKVCDEINEFVKISESTKVAIVAHSIPHAFFNESESSIICRPYSNRCLFVGRLVPSKGVETLISIAKSNPDISLTIVGENRGGYDFSKCGNIDYKGPIRDFKKLKALYLEADFLFLPSKKIRGWQELFGMVVVEAMTQGCIPLCTDNEGPRQILEEKFSELVFSEDGYIDGVNSKLFIAKSGKWDMQRKRQKLVQEGKKYSVGEIGKKWKLLFQ